MKKQMFLFVIMTLLIAPLAMLLSACGNIEFKIKFIVDGQEYAVVNTAGNEMITMPENPTKTDYEFDGWYWDENVWQNPFTANSLLNQPLNSDMKVYAKWNDSNELKGTNANFIDFEKINNSTYSISLTNTTEIINMSEVVEINNKSSWQLATDIQANNTIPSKIATLNIGDNTYYVLVTAENGDVKLYTLKIRRRPIYTISFGEYAENQYIEENDYAIKPVDPEKTGYTFINWDFDFTNKIVKNEEINAIWKENEYENVVIINMGTIAITSVTAGATPSLASVTTGSTVANKMVDGDTVTVSLSMVNGSNVKVWVMVTAISVKVYDYTNSVKGDEIAAYEGYFKYTVDAVEYDLDSITPDVNPVALEAGEAPPSRNYVLTFDSDGAVNTIANIEESAIYLEVAVIIKAVQYAHIADAAAAKAILAPVS